MESRDLAKRLRTSVVLIALSSLLVACGEKTEAPAEAELADGNRGVAYVTNQDGDITIIDLNTMEASGTIDPKGNGIRGIGITPDGKLLVTANKEEGNISIINVETGELVQHVDIGKNPEFVRVVGDLAYVSFEPSSTGGPPPKPGAEATHDDDDDDDDDEEPARIAVVDIKQGKKLREIIGGPETEGIEFSTDGTKLIITNEADNTITVHDIETGELLKTIPTADFGDRPRGIKASPDGNQYIATLEFGNNFMVLDKEFNLVRTVDTGAAPYGVAYNRAGDLIYIASGKAKTLEVYNAETFEKVNEVATGDRCWHFTFTPDDKDILLACGRSNEVLVIDTEKLEVTKRISGKELPWGIIAYPKSVGSLDAPE